MDDGDHRINELVYPVYLDVPMLISFLAALEGGVSIEDQATKRSSTATAGEREARGRIGLPSVLSLLSLDMSGRLASRHEDQDFEEVVALERARLDQRWREFCLNAEQCVAETTRQRPRAGQTA